MDMVSELNDYVRFLFKHLHEKETDIQDKDTIIYEMAVDLKFSEQFALQQKHRFSGRSQKNKKACTTKHEEATTDRQQDKDDFDSNSISISND